VDEDDENKDSVECCNPYKIHSKSVFKGLREIKKVDVERIPSLTVGLAWCDTCRKANPDDFLKKETTSEGNTIAVS
jgi:hypothetical protein